ncbi:NAD-dependent epimerase/dehydratase family protein [Sinosporangium siamense]|uniref:NAD-dependent epimerase n=1 Tax=Sinosporangium siamense TaxID=1367973 RepID=A0A919RLT0_9ACTN|nr:NAD-dependent epimerase/dehydratase family protein [Sinosporangium siamense]GII96156.1 NAD-dependent epimerase [Sinosporangium siamense]
MRIIVVGASGNVGTSVLSALEADPAVTAVVGVADRRANKDFGAKTSWQTADVTHDDLVPLFRGADVVIHLAWLFQPTRDSTVTWRTNVLGSMRVFDAVARADVPALVYASSVGAYSPGPRDRAVDESWPTHGWPRAAYGREKAYVERILDVFVRDHRNVRVVRLRPGFVFQRAAASEQRRLFAGPFLPGKLIKHVPVLPDLPGLRLQTVHADDMGQAYRLAAVRQVSGPFNIAADPVLTTRELAKMLGAKMVTVAPWLARGALAAAWHAHLVPASPGLFEMAMHLPVMDTTRARTELGWSPHHSASDAVREVIEGLSEGAGMDTPPLKPDGSRLTEISTGLGERR